MRRIGARRGVVEQTETKEGSVGNSEGENDTSQTNRRIRGVCVEAIYAPWTIQALGCPPRARTAPWDQATGGPPKPGKEEDEESDGEVQGGAG